MKRTILWSLGLTKLDVILDLKYRPSPNVEDEQWCAGALALHAHYRNVRDILQLRGVASLQSNASLFCTAYQYWSAFEQGEGLLRLPKLKMYENNMKRLQATHNTSSRLRGRSKACGDEAHPFASQDDDDCSTDDNIFRLGDVEDTINRRIDLWKMR